MNQIFAKLKQVKTFLMAKEYFRKTESKSSKLKT